ncbi:MAG: S8 family serine peptidase [Alistipes sp.]
MKRLLLACLLLSLFACTKEFSEDSGRNGDQSESIVVGAPALAAKGTLAVKLTPEAAQAVTQAQTRSGEATRSGVENLDAVLTQIGARHFERIIAYDAQWEALYTETGLNRWYRVAFDDEVALAKAGQLFAERPEIAVVEYTLDPCHRRKMSEGKAQPLTNENCLPMDASTRASLPMNDVQLSRQWNFRNEGPAEYKDFKTPPEAGADINLFDAWQLCAGNQQVIVAVIDEPVQTTHPDLKDNMWSNPANPNEHGYNFWNRSSKLDWTSAGQDSQGEWEYADHGSHVAGVIAAVNNNGRGVCGIAGGKNGGGVKIMSCQIMGYSDTNKDDDADVKAFDYAMRNGALIAQNSWGYGNDVAESAWNQTGGTQFSVLRDAMKTFIKGAGRNNPSSPLKGGIVVFAAGNDGDIVGDKKIWPAAYDPLIAVGSMDWRFRPAYYTDYGEWVDITAPGGDVYAGKAMNGKLYGNAQILSTILCDDAIDYQDGRKDKADWYGYGFMQGTSMACPHVSGVAALGLSYAAQLGKQFTPEEFTALLLSSVSEIDSHFTGSKPGEGMTINNLGIYRGKMGGGCVDALKLLLAIKGTPASYVKTGAAVEVDFSKYFGGTVSLQSVSAPDLAAVGMTTQPVIKGKKITFNCTKPGMAMVTITAKAGDTTFTREFAIVSRAGLAGNGGWL